MNFLQKIAVKALNASGMMASVNEAIYKWIGMNMPIWMKYNVEQYIEQGYEKNADLYSIVSKISGAAAFVPWCLYEMVDGEKVKIDEHPILDLWQRPNDMQGGHEFREELLSFFLMTGNGYIHGVGPRTGEDVGKWSEFYLMPSQYVEIIHGGWKQPIKSYKLRWDQEISVPKQEVMHIRMPNLDYRRGQSLYGMSPVSAAARAVTSSNAGFEAKVRDYQNGGLKGFISSASNNPEPLGVDATQLKKIRNDLKKAGQKREIPATDYPLKFNEVGMSIQDMAILESMEADLRTICNIYGISSQLFNDTKNSTYNNLNEAKKSMYTDVIQPILKKLQDELHRWWISSYDNLIFEPDYSSIEVLQEDLKNKAEWVNNTWPLTPNQKLEALGFETSEDPRMDQVWIPANLIPVDQLMGTSEDIDPDELSRLQLEEYGNMKVHVGKKSKTGTK